MKNKGQPNPAIAKVASLCRGSEFSLQLTNIEDLKTLSGLSVVKSKRTWTRPSDQGIKREDQHYATIRILLDTNTELVFYCEVISLDTKHDLINKYGFVEI